MTYKSVTEQLEREAPLTIIGHLDPDGDCVGAMLALYFAFGGRRKGWKMLLQDEVGDKLLFLPGAEKIGLLSSAEQLRGRVLLVDCHELKRAVRFDAQESLPADSYIEELYCIDHHPPADTRGAKLIVPAAAACCELIFKLIKKAGRAIDKDTALALYTGIAADTACFRQANTTAETLAVASRLLAVGVDTETVRVNLFERRSAANIKILGKALCDMETYFGNKLCFMSASYADKQLYGAGPDDCTSIVSYTLTPDGACIGVFFEEREPGTVKISFRSRGAYDVRRIAELLGGGGHMLAAGATVSGEPHEVKARVLRLITDYYFS